MRNSVRNIKFHGATHASLRGRRRGRRRRISVTSSLSGSRRSHQRRQQKEKKENGKKEEKYARGRLMLSNFGRNRALDTYRDEHYGDARGRALEAASGWQLPHVLPAAASGGVYTCRWNKKFLRGQHHRWHHHAGIEHSARLQTRRSPCLRMQIFRYGKSVAPEQHGVPVLVARGTRSRGRGEGCFRSYSCIKSILFGENSVSHRGEATT